MFEMQFPPITIRDTLAFFERVTRVLRDANDPILREWGAGAAPHLDALRGFAEVPNTPGSDLEAPVGPPSRAIGLRRRPRAALSPREEQVLRWIARGYSHKEVAMALGLSVKTIETHKANAFDRLGLGGRADLIRHALAVGWLQ